MNAEFELQDRGDDTSRLGGLSDGIFGVALTLLVLDLRLPEAVTGSLTVALVSLLPKLWSYALTFGVVGAFWIGHHGMMRHIVGYSRNLLWLNLMFLALVTLVPFPTALVGRFTASSHDAQTAWTVYSLNLALLGLALFAMWRLALAEGLVTDGVSSRLAGYLSVRPLVTPFVFMVSIIVYFASPTAAHFSPISIPPLLAAVRRAYGRRGA